MFAGNNSEKLTLINNLIPPLGLNEFEEKVLKEIKPVLILCVRQDPEFQNQLKVIESVYKTFVEKVKMYFLWEDDLKTFEEKFAVKGTPTFLLFVNGAEKGRLLGRTDSNRLLNFLSGTLRIQMV